MCRWNLMPSALVLLFWVWTAISLIVIARRLVVTGSVRAGRPPRHTTPSRPASQARPAPDGVPAPRRETDLGATRPPVGGATLAEALQGIRMPADLSPVSTDHIDARRAVFVTASATAETVATAVADELERLGFLLDPVGHDTITARRNDSLVEVRVIDPPAPNTSTAGVEPSWGSPAGPSGTEVAIEFVLR